MSNSSSNAAIGALPPENHIRRPGRFKVNRRAPALNPQLDGIRYGNSFVAEREMSATEERFQSSLASLERAVGLR